MFKLESAKRVAMSRNIAVMMQNLHQVPGERNLNKVRIAHMEREIDSGNIVTFHWVTAEVSGNSSVRYRINGQHTSYIFATRREPVGSILLEHYICDSIEDVISLWSRFDSAVSSRTKNDIFNTTQSGCDELSGLPIQQLRLASRAVCIVEFKSLNAKGHSHYDKAQLILKHIGYAQWACDVLKHKSCQRVGVYFAAFHMYHHSYPRATQFWQEVQNGSNPNPYSGSRQLQLILFEFASTHRTGKKFLRLDQLADLCTQAWRKWLAGRDVKKLQWSQSRFAKFVGLDRSTVID